jgi:D-tyrosyl-tRNA(Tyr) deacylase
MRQHISKQSYIEFARGKHIDKRKDTHMRAVLTRVSSASVTIDGEVVGKIGRGFLILLGVGPEDTETECRALAEKALALRVFEDENGKMNLGLEAIGGEVLVVSQFTLYGNCRKGRRPSFAGAAGPELGEKLYEQFLADCESLGYPPQRGRFGADMKVESVNDGPVTLILDTDQLLHEPRR